MRSEAITHSLNEIRREFLNRESHKVITYTSDNRSWNLEFIHDRACIIEFCLDANHKFVCARSCWKLIESGEYFEHPTTNDTTTLPYTKDFTEVYAPLKFSFCDNDKLKPLEIRSEIDERERVVEKLCRELV